MALPRPERRYRSASGGSAPDHVSPVQRATRGGKLREVAPRDGVKGAALRRRRFVAVVVLPALLMLGSVYLHTVSAGVEGRVSQLEERLTAANAESQQLEVRVSELSQPGRVRDMAQQIGMQDAAGADMETYGKDGEDGTDNDGGERRTEGGP